MKITNKFAIIIIFFLHFVSTIHAENITINYTYDNVGHLNEANLSNNININYNYDAAGNIISIKKEGSENLPPTVATEAASLITSTSATLNGTVNPNGAATTCYFQYGTTTSYGKVTPTQSKGSGTANVAVTAALTGLTANTTYHYKLVAANSAGTAYGVDKSFTTKSVDKPVISVSPSSQNVANTSGTITFTVSNTGIGIMDWTAAVTSGNTWLRITSGSSGSNPAGSEVSSRTISCAYDANTTTSARTGTITVTATGATGSPKSVTVTQAAGAISNLTSIKVLNDNSAPLTINYGEYVKVFGSAGGNDLNVLSGGRVECVNFVGSNNITIADERSDFTVYRSGATVYLKNATTGTFIKIPATKQTQNLNFSDGGLLLSISNGKVMLFPFNQEVTLTETPIKIQSQFTATTGTATSITGTTATLTGTVNPNGIDTLYHFVYIPSEHADSIGSGFPFYVLGGKETPSQSAGSGNSTITVTANITELTANTSYTYLIVAFNNTGEVTGVTQTFITKNQ